MKHRCPICHKIVKVPAQGENEEAKFFPFCSKQCKLIDLGAWLDAKYRISEQKTPASADSQGTSKDAPSDKR